MKKLMKADKKTELSKRDIIRKRGEQSEREEEK